MVASGTLKNKSSECVSELLEKQNDANADLPQLDDWDQWVVSGSHLGHAHYEEHACQFLAQQFERCLSRAKRTTLHCSQVLVPERLTRRIARDVLRLSCGEPCGLRGCVLHVHLETRNVCRKLERIVYDAGVVPTFELTLVFKQDVGTWPSLTDLLLMGACFTPRLAHALTLSSGFRLIKRKLYSPSAGAVVEEY